MFLDNINKKSKNNILNCLPRFILVSLVLSMMFLSAIFLQSCTPKENVKLYFAKYEGNNEYLVAEERSIIKNEDFYKSVIEELIKGPKSEQLYPTLPKSVKVYSVKVNDSLAEVNFSKEIILNTSEIPHSSSTEVLAIFSIVNTLTEFDQIKKVRILVEGKKSGQIDGIYIEDFWGHMGIYEDFERNEEKILEE